MPRRLRLPALAAAFLSTSACMSAAPPGALDYGRGAQAMSQGTTRTQLGVGAGAAPFVLAAGGGGGARIEHQLFDDVALSADATAGVQDAAIYGITGSSGAYLGAHWNPFGIEWLALRARVGGGLDMPLPLSFGGEYGGPATTFGDPYPTPYLGAVAQLVLSQRFDAIEAYAAPTFGLKQFLGDRERFARLTYGVGGTGYVDTMVAPGLTLGLAAHVTSNFSFYASANGTGSVLLGVQSDLGGKTGGPLVALSPSGNVQTGLALEF